MKKIRFLRLFLSRFLVKYFSQFKYLALLLVVIIIALILKFTAFSGQRPKLVSEGIIGTYTHSNLPGTVTQLISEPLVDLEDDDRPKPGLASWQVNSNATVYTLKLKDNLFWQDGSRVKSSDIRFSLSDVEVTYPDPSTIVFKLADTFYPFPSLLTSPVLKHDSLMGMGKYRVIYQEVSHSVITKLILEPADTSLPPISIRFYPDEKTARTAFELGEIDSLIGVSEVGDNQGANINFKKVVNFNRLVAVFFNTKDNILSDKNLRKALSFSSPNIANEEKSRTSIVPYSWAYNSAAREMTEDLTIAKTYLDKTQIDKIGTITLTTTPSLSSLGEKIVENWKKLGVNAILRTEGGIPQNFQALLISQPIPTDPDQYALWHSTQATNLSKYSSPRVDKDLEDGRKTGDLEKRKEKYLDFQKVLMDDMPADFLYFPKTVVIYRKRVEESLNKIIPLQIPKN